MKNETVENLAPRIVVWNGFVELWSDFCDFRQVTSWYFGEIVVLNVVSNVVRNPVQATVVRIRFLTGNELKMCGNEMTAHWMDSKTENNACNEVDHGFDAPEIDHTEIPQTNDQPIGTLGTVDWMRLG